MVDRASLPSDSLGFKERVSLTAARNWRVVVAACLGLIGVAILAWKNIPRLEDARIESPGAMVTILYPGASPEDVEAQVIRELEPVLNDLSGLNLFESTARPSVATMVLKFQDGTNMDSTVEQIRGRILSKRSDLPTEVRDPTVVKFTTAFTAQMVVAIAGYRSESILTDAADHLKDELLALPGVSTVQLRGERRTAVRIAFDPERLAHHGLTTEAVVARLQQNSVRIPAGTLDVGHLVTLLEVEHEAKGAAAIAKIPIGLSRDALGTARTLTLAEVADVKDQYLPMRQRFLQDGVPAVGIEVRFRNDANATLLGRSIHQTIHQYQRRLPPGVTARLAYDQPEWVDRALRNFTESLFEGILLVMGVVTLGLGLRAATAVAFAVPLSIGGALFGLFAFGFALEQVSIAGLIVALGLLVDDAVVVTESVQLMRDRGLSALRASVLGTARVFWANNVTTAVACAAFMPFFFMGADIGRFVRGLPTAVVLALTTSLIVAQVVTPWVSSKILRKTSNAPSIEDSEAFAKRLDVGDNEREERNPALFVLKWLYVRLVPVIVRRPFVIVAVSTMLLGASLCLFPRIGLQFFPKADKPLLFVRVELPRGTHESVTARTVAHAVKMMRQYDFVEESSALIGAGYPPIFIGRATPYASTDVGDILVRLRPGTTSRDASRTLEHAFSEIAGARVHVEELYTGPPVPHPIMIRVVGDDFDRLRGYAEQIKTMLRRQPGTVDVRDNLSETVPITRVEVDADRAMRYGVTPAQVGLTLRWLYGEDKIWEYRQDRDTATVLLSPAPISNQALVDLEQTRIQSASGTLIPLFSVAKVVEKRGFAELHRRNSRRDVEITCDLAGNALASRVVQAIRPELDRTSWDPGYSYSFAGHQQETEDSFVQLALAAVGALVVIAILLLLLFNSFRLTFIIVCAVPYVLIGVLPGLAFTGNSFGFMAFLGTVALLGVFVNHKIYFIDRALELTRRGYCVQDAIRQAGLDRIRPVVLTALTAILGLLPLTLKGGPLWSAFGWVNVFGLIASIPLSLVLLPALMAIVVRQPETRPL